MVLPDVLITTNGKLVELIPGTCGNPDLMMMRKARSRNVRRSMVGLVRKSVQVK